MKQMNVDLTENQYTI